MIFNLIRAAAVSGLVVLGGCNTTKSDATASATNIAPSADGPNPRINPDGTVDRITVNR